MKVLGLLILLFATAGFAAERYEYFTHPSEPFHGPQSYKDPDSGVIIYVESDGRHVTAIGPDGKIRWHRDPFADAHLEFYRTKTPRIVLICRPGTRLEEQAAKAGKKLIELHFNSSQFGLLDFQTGDFYYRGAD